MTTNQQQAQADRLMLDHAGLKSAIAGSLQKLLEHQRDFDQAIVEIQTFDKKIAEFNAQIGARKATVDEASKKIRAQYKNEGTDAKVAVKEKTQRRASLEEIEDFEWLVQDATRARIHSELRATSSSRAYLDVRNSILCDAGQYLESVVIKNLPVEVLMYIQIKAEIAACGLSVLYNENPAIGNPMEFARNQFNCLIFTEFKNMNPAFGMGSFLPPYPESIGEYKRTPLQIKKIEDDLAAMDGTQ